MPIILSTPLSLSKIFMPDPLSLPCWSSLAWIASDFPAGHSFAERKKNVEDEYCVVLLERSELSDNYVTRPSNNYDAYGLRKKTKSAGISLTRKTWIYSFFLVLLHIIDKIPDILEICSKIVICYATLNVRMVTQQQQQQQQIDKHIFLFQGVRSQPSLSEHERNIICFIFPLSK